MALRLALDPVALGVQGEVRGARSFEGDDGLGTGLFNRLDDGGLAYPLSAMTYCAGNPASNGSACVQSVLNAAFDHRLHR